MVLKKVNLEAAFGSFSETWSPRIAGEINDSHVKLAKLEGPFTWHHHELEDEMFLVIKGRLRMELRSQEAVILDPGEFIVVPKGVEHRPVAEEPCEVLLLEPKTTLNTGNVENDFTVADLKRLD
ncbi:MAG: cupin domain-containing protein [Magnetovibrionaceae bacterium]